MRDSRHAQPGGVSCPLLTRGPLGSQGPDGKRHILSQVGEDICARSPSQEEELGFEPRTPSSKYSFDLFLGTEKLSARRKKAAPREESWWQVIQSPLPLCGFHLREAASRREDIKCQAPPWGHASLGAADHMVSWEPGQRARG